MTVETISMPKPTRRVLSVRVVGAGDPKADLRVDWLWCKDAGARLAIQKYRVRDLFGVHRKYVRGRKYGGEWFEKCVR